jgi:hypothetical protein
MIWMVAAILLTRASAHGASIPCGSAGPDSASWSVTETPVFTIRLPSTYQYRAIDVTSGFSGKWTHAGTGKQRSINFMTGRLEHFPRQSITSICKESIGGRFVRIETGIGPTGRYFVRFEWLEALPRQPDSFLTIWADTADPNEQAEALAALRTVQLNAGGA